MTYTAYVDLENNLEHDETFHIELPQANVRFLETIDVTLASGEKRSLPITYQVDEMGLYDQHAVIRYGNHTINKQIKAIFKGVKEAFIADLEKDVQMVSGNYILTYRKDSNEMHYRYFSDERVDPFFMAPKIGQPYTLELSHIQPKIEIVSDKTMVLTYQSQTFKQVDLNIFITHHFGLLEVSYELVNKGEKRELALSIPMGKSLFNTYIPYQSKLLKIGQNGGYIGYLNTEFIDENWMYDDRRKAGFSWPDDIRLSVSDWHISFNIEDIVLKPNERFKTKPFMISLIHSTVKGFREFIHLKDKKQVIQPYELEINGFNPMIDGVAKARYISHQKMTISGTMTNNYTTCDISESLEVNDGLQSFKIELADRIMAY